LTYVTTVASGCFCFIATSASGVTMFAIGQPACASGINTVLCGLRILAVSAMKCTPQNTMTSASVAAASRLRPRESPRQSAMSCTSGGW